MSLPVIVIRPEPGCAATTRAARDIGLEALAFPLFHIGARAWQPPEPEMVDALLIGSANAVRKAGDPLNRFRGKPVYAVGQVTADVAQAEGLTLAHVGTGGMQAVLDTVRAPMRLLRLAGEEHVPLRVPAGVGLETRVIYAAEPVPMPLALTHILRTGAVVLLHSAAAARHFASECDRLELPPKELRLAALGPRIAEAAGGGWGILRSAPSPADGPLLALAADLCHVSGEAKER